MMCPVRLPWNFRIGPFGAIYVTFVMKGRLPEAERGRTRPRSLASFAGRIRLSTERRRSRARQRLRSTHGLETRDP